MKILIVVAHPDDAEFEMGGLCLLSKKHGYEIQILSISNGCCGHHILSKIETKKRRLEETKKVAQILNIKYNVFDDINDCEILNDLNTRKRLIRYIRKYNPNVIITHRPNDYHPDHRNTSLLIQDCSFLLTVPNECDDVKAMEMTPLILFHEDLFNNPEFKSDILIDIDNVIEEKYLLIHQHSSQVYEWLPFIEHDPRAVPIDDESRLQWLIGENITSNTTDEEVNKMKYGYGPKFAKTASRFRKQLIEKYGYEKGSKVRFCEAYQISEYGLPVSNEELLKIFPF